MLFWIASLLLLTHKNLAASELNDINSFNFSEPIDQHVCPYLRIGKDTSVPVVCWPTCGIPKVVKKMVKIQKDCCPGYTRSKAFMNKCIVSQRSTLMTTDYLTSVGKRFCARALENNEHFKDLTAYNSEYPYTIFLPYIDTDIKSSQVNYIEEKNSTNQLIARGRWYAKDFVNNFKIPTLMGTNMIISTFSNGMTFIDCKILIKPDQETLNGIIHEVHGTPSPSYKFKTIYEALRETYETRKFADDLPQDLIDKLNSTASNTLYTVFAPNNEAWVNLKSTEKDASRRHEIIKNHILDKIVCAMAITGSMQKVGPTLGGSWINLEIKNDKQAYIYPDCGSKIFFSKKDIMSSNGVVHGISGIIYNIRTMDMDETFGCLALSSIHNVNWAANRMKTCKLALKDNAIVLLPNDKALEWARRSNEAWKYRQQIDKNFSFQCEVMKNHILISHEKYANGLPQKKMFASLLEKSSICVTYQKKRTGSKLYFNYAQAVNLKPIEYNGGSIYVIDKIIYPAELTIDKRIEKFQDSIITHRKFEDSSTIFGINKQLGLENQQNWKRLIEHEGNSEENRKKIMYSTPGFIFLSPVDVGWSTRSKEMNYTQNEFRNFFLLHTIKGMIFGGGVNNIDRGSVVRVSSMLKKPDGKFQELIIHRKMSGETFVGYDGLSQNNWTMVLDWMNPVENGNIWKIDWPLACLDALCKLSNE